MRRIVVAVATSLLARARVLQPVVPVDPGLVLGGYLLVVVEVGAGLDRVLVGRDLYELPLVVYPGELHRDEGGSHPEETRLDAYVLRLVVLVHEEVVYLADPLVVLIVDRVILVSLF